LSSGDASFSAGSDSVGNDMTSWREFQAQRRVRSREFFARRKALRLSRAFLVVLILVPPFATTVLLDYGDLLGLGTGTPRYQLALAVVLFTGVGVLGIVVALAVARWKAEGRLTEAFAAVGFAAIPVAWLAVAACVLDLKADAPACGSGAIDLVFGSTIWMLGWIFLGPFVDFFRERRRGPSPSR